MSPLSVSVVVPAYNCEKTILKTLQALLNQTFKNVDIIVVDDGSTDNTAEIVKNVDRVRYFYQKNAGPATARNFGAAQSRSDLIFFTDSDCIAAHNWIETAISGFKDEKVGVVSGSYGISNPESRLARCIHQEILYRHHYLMPKYPKSFGSYNFGIRSKLFQAIGGFNQSYRSASGEDNDLSYKVLKANYKIFFEKNALVAHFHPVFVQKYLKEQFRHGFWRVKMYKDHLQMAQGDDYTFWKDILEVPMVASVFLAGIFGLFVKSISLMCIPSTLLYGLQLIFGLRMIKGLSEGFYFSVVTFLRAFARTLGFSSGFFYFLLKK